MKDWYWGSNLLCHINRNDTGAVRTVSYQYNWYCDNSGLCRNNRTDTWTVMECVVSIGVVLRQWWTVSYQ